MDWLQSAALAAIIAVFGSAGFWAWLESRRRDKSSAEQGAIKAVMEAMVTTVEALKERVTELNAENGKLRETLEKVRETLEKVREEFSHCKDLLEELGKRK